MRIPEKVKSELKKPLGKVYPDYGELKRLSKEHMIISVGDICTLGLLDVGIKPHLAVFDFKYMRRKLDSSYVSILKLTFPKPKRMKNPKGTISQGIIDKAPELVREGGAIFIDGEEDLTALAFIAAASDAYVLVYGQPGEGLVLVMMDEKTKKKATDLLSVSLAHKVK